MDIFAEEQKKFEIAVERVREVREGKPVEAWEFEQLVAEYGKLLKELRRATRMADRTAATLHSDNVGLSDKVNHDALTGLYNRRYMEDTLEKIVKDLSRGDDPLTVMILDVDFFKKFNDTYGHQAGDECLKEVANALNECVTREGDFVARYGGEEFVVVLPRSDEEGGRRVAEKLLENVRKKYIVHEKNEAAPCVTISIGVTTVKPQHTDKSHHYIQRADQALYASKQNGRNRYTFLMYREDETPTTPATLA